MRRRIIYCFWVVATLIVFASCNKNQENALMDFGIHFGEMVQNKDAQGIKSVYPDVGEYTDSHLVFYRDKIDIFPEGDDKYKIRYSDGAYIIVRTGLNGAIEVTSSQGIFENKPMAKTSGKTEQTKKESISNSVPEPRINSVFEDGYNVLYGSFNYKGAEYGFTVSFNYNTSTGKVRNAVYYADYNTSGAKNPINSMIISANEKSITISGPKLSIKASGSGGYYSGKMTRGDHSGTCTMSL